MKLRPIKPGHVTNCRYCKSQGQSVQAIWHLTGRNYQACGLHKYLLEDEIEKERKFNSGEYSEADEQTWRRL